MRAVTLTPPLPPCRIAGCLGLLVLALALASPAWAQEQNEATTVEEVQAEIAEAMDAVGRYTADERDEALATLDTALERLDAEIEEMEYQIRARWSEMSQTARERTSGALADLRVRRNQLSQTYGALSQSAASAWDDLLAGMREEWTALESAWDDAAMAADPDAETGD